MKKLAVFLLLASSFVVAQTKAVVRKTATATAVVHSVDLSWGASTSPGILNYIAYRGTVTGGPYTNIGQVAGNVLTYHDATVLAGTTYFYEVTAKDANFESAKSNEAKAIVPADPVPPNPPVNLTVTAQ